MIGDGKNGRGGMSGSDLRVIAYSLVGILAAIVALDFLGEWFIEGYHRTESAYVGVVVGGLVSIALGRLIWPRNGGGGGV